MGYVVTEVWTAKEGMEDAVADALVAMTPSTRGETGCEIFEASRSTEDPRRFFVYEQYVDEAAFKRHTTTAHFEDFMERQAFPNLASSEGGFYETLWP